MTIVSWARAHAILGPSWPVSVALVAHNVMTLITIAMVGRLGDAALAGIGIGGTLFSMLLAMLFGLDTAVQAAVARRAGSSGAPTAAAVLNDALLLSILAGLLLATTAFAAGPAIVATIAHDPAVIESGSIYLRTLSPTLLFIGASFAFSAYWNGTGMPKLPLLATLIQLPCNVLFTWLLIFGGSGVPRLEVAGAGLGVALAAFVALVVNVLLVVRFMPARAFPGRAPTLSGMAGLLRMGLPVSIQQFFLYVGTTFFFAIVAQLGTREIAAVNVMISLLLVPILASTGIGVAAATLVGQALGRHDAADARRWGWDASRLGALLIAPPCLAILAVPRSTLGLFIVDATTIALAVAPLRLMALSMCIDAFGRVLVFALRGAYAAPLPAMVSFALQWGAQLPLCWYVGVHLGHGLVGVFLVRLALCAVESVTVATIWHRGAWHRNRQARPA